MHQVNFPQAYLDRLVARRGRLHVFESIEPSTTALIVVDMQNAFVAEGAPYECPPARDIVPTINRLAVAMREAGGEVVVAAIDAAAARRARPVDPLLRLFREPGAA